MDCNCQKCGGKIENNDYFLIGFYINKNYTQMRMICKECTKKMKVDVKCVVKQMDVVNILLFFGILWSENFMYDDCPCGYPTVETKIKNQTDLMKLYSLNEYQKSFHARVTFKVELIDTFNIKINYSIPSMLR